MSSGALQPEYDFNQPISAVEASNQLLTGRILTLVDGITPADEMALPDTNSQEKGLSRLRAEDAIAVTATTETVEVKAVANEDQTSDIPSTTLDSNRVKELLAEDLNADSRIANLLTYAWNSSSTVGQTIPHYLIVYATDNPGDWYIANLQIVKRIIDERSGLSDMYDQTDEYETLSPFLRNASTIHDMAFNRGKRSEGLIIEVSARLIVLEAIQSKKLAVT